MPLSSLTAEQLRALVQDTSSFTWSIHGDHDAPPSEQWRALTGQTTDEARGDGWLDAIHPEDRARVAAAWGTAVAHGQNYNTDCRILSAAGYYRWFNLRGVPVRNRDGSIDHWVGLCLEVPGLARFPDVEPASDVVAPGEGVALEPSILRAARAMLNWSAQELAKRSGVSVSTIRRLEQDDAEIQPRRTSSARLMKVFVDAGLDFTDGGHVVRGVRWRPTE